ncbi:MAG TPA: helix-turn-helix domain-containing protein [Terriglobia bacterium]|nr:helix-turn-helix domain-containing protein [Terriglobia bacterium]
MAEQQKKMRPKHAARFIGIAMSTLARMRARGDGPVFSKPSSRIIVYDREEIEKWLRANCNQLQMVRGD